MTDYTYDYDYKFREAAEKVRYLHTPPTDDEKLYLYGLYKQITVGDNTTLQPWYIEFEARAKWDAWTKQKGTPLRQAQDNYIQMVNYLIEKYGLIS